MKKSLPKALAPCLVIWLISAGCSLQPIHGELRTKDDQALLFSSQDRQLLLTPGRLSAFMDEQPASGDNIRLKNDKGEIRIPTRPENFRHNHFQINSAQAGTSTDLKGVWRETTLQLETRPEFEACTSPGICPQIIEVLICPDKEINKRSDSCKRHFETLLRHAWNCPGHMAVENTYQSFTVTLELEFIDAKSKADQLAKFSGNSPPRKRLVNRRELGPCLVP